MVSDNNLSKTKTIVISWWLLSDIGPSIFRYTQNNISLEHSLVRLFLSTGRPYVAVGNPIGGEN